MNLSDPSTESFISHRRLTGEPRFSQRPTEPPPLTREEVLKLYKQNLFAALWDGSISPHEKALLDKFRRTHNVSDEEQLHVLESLGFSEEGYELAIEHGEEESPDEKYGECSYPTEWFSAVHHPKAFPVLCCHTLAAPRLRQFYGEKHGEKHFWRERGERKATWLELFLDLVFVALIFKLGGATTSSTLPQYLLCYATAFSLWQALTNYSTRYEPVAPNWLHPPIYYWIMFITLALNIYTDDVFQKNPSGMQGFAVVYVLGMLPLFGAYALATVVELVFKDRVLGNRETTYHPLMMTLVYVASLIPWAVSFFKKDISSDMISYLWVGGLLTFEAGSALANMMEYHRAPISVEHFGERYGLFVMIHLGETMFAISQNFSPHGIFTDGYYRAFISVAAGLLVAFAFRKVYFEVEGEHKDPHALRRNRVCAYLWCLSHIVFCCCIILFAVGVKGLHKLVVSELTLRHDTIQNITMIDTTNTTFYEEQVAAMWNATDAEVYYLNKKYLYPYRSYFCYAIGIMIATILFQGFLSRTSPKKNYRFSGHYSPYVRAVFRVIFIIIICCIPSTKLYAFESVVTTGVLCGVWSLIENILTLPLYTVWRDEEDEFHMKEHEREEAAEKMRKMKK